MNTYEIELKIAPGTADSTVLDALAGVIYGQPEFDNPLLGLDDDGSISASFCAAGPDPLATARDSVNRFLTAFAQATGRPHADIATVERLSISFVGMGDDEAMALALEAQHATRAQRR
jgi:hypothetical protein